MYKNITQNDLILYTYSELEEPRLSYVKKAIAEDVELQSQCGKLDELQALLDSEMRSPHPTSVQIILEESASTALQIC